MFGGQFATPPWPSYGTSAKGSQDDQDEVAAASFVAHDAKLRQTIIDLRRELADASSRRQTNPGVGPAPER